MDEPLDREALVPKSCLQRRGGRLKTLFEHSAPSHVLPLLGDHLRARAEMEATGRCTVTPVTPVLGATRDPPRRGAQQGCPSSGGGKAEMLTAASHARRQQLDQGSRGGHRVAGHRVAGRFQPPGGALQDLPRACTKMSFSKISARAGVHACRCAHTHAHAHTRVCVCLTQLIRGRR